MLADLTRRQYPVTTVARCGPSPAALRLMSAADRELEAQIAAVRAKLNQACTSFGRRMALVQLDLLEGRRSPEALRILSMDRMLA